VQIWLTRSKLATASALALRAIVPATTYAGDTRKATHAATPVQAVLMVVQPYFVPGYTFANCTKLNPRLHPNLT
jgi:hypothetical protein